MKRQTQQKLDPQIYKKANKQLQTKTILLDWKEFYGNQLKKPNYNNFTYCKESNQHKTMLGLLIVSSMACLQQMVVRFIPPV